MSYRRNPFDLYWWVGHYNSEINRICSRTQIMRDMGLLSEEVLQKSNEELYKNIMYLKNINAIIDKQEENGTY